MQQHPVDVEDEDGDEEGGGFDLSMVRDYVSYAIRAVRLHPLLTGGIFVGVVTLAFGVLKTLPKSYHVETRLLATRDAMPGHAAPSYGWDPLKGASDVVMSHEHLTMLIKQLDLTTWWVSHMAPAQRAKWNFMLLFGHPPAEEDQIRTLIDILSQKMAVWQGDGTVTFQIDWPSGEMAARILDTAEQNFLEKRHVAEISTIAESISILEQNAARVRKEVEDMVGGPKGDDQKAADGAKPAAGAAAPADSAGKPATAPKPAAPVTVVRKVSHRRPEMEAELARQKVMLESKQRAISDLEDYRQRRVLELQTSLAEQRSKYTDQHPVIVGIQENIAAFSKESPQVAALRVELKTMQDAYDRMRKEADDSDEPSVVRVGTAAGGQAGSASEAALVVPPREDRDPTMETQISYAIANYARIRNDIDAAKVDLDFAQAAFRHRYVVTLPAEPPRGPNKPKVPIILGGAAALGLLLGLLAAVLSELRSGRFVNRWQVERFLKLPVLAELNLPAANPKRPEEPS